MTVETVTYIDDLNASYPAGTDNKSEGDNHIRNIKTGLLATFPNLTGPMTATQTELNYIDGSSPGVAIANKALVLGASKNVDTLNVTKDGFKIGGAAVTTTAAELNKLDGATATTAEINHLSGVTSNIQTQLDGNILQIVNTTSGASITGTGLIPYDDTIPQNTEGFQVFTVAITPVIATSKLKIDVLVNICTDTTSSDPLIALFKDTTANALAVATQDQEFSNEIGQHTMSHYMVSGTTSEITFKVRAGTRSGGTVYINGTTVSPRLFGGVFNSSITVTEFT